MNIPSNLKYSNDHEWIRLEGNEAYVGITDYAQSQLGDIVFVEVETVDETFVQGDTFGTIEAVKTVSDMMMPIGGTILELNPELDSKPELINSDPYGNGWIIKISVADVAEIDSLMDAEAYAAFTNS